MSQEKPKTVGFIYFLIDLAIDIFRESGYVELAFMPKIDEKIFVNDQALRIPLQSLQNKITSLVVGDYYTINYVYDFLGRLSVINTPVGKISYEYQTGQGYVIRELPNGVKTVWEFSVNGQLKRLTHVDPNDLLLEEFNEPTAYFTIKH